MIYNYEIHYRDTREFFYDAFIRVTTPCLLVTRHWICNLRTRNPESETRNSYHASFF